MDIVLVRHPRAAIPPGRCYGRLDLDLHPDGAAEIGRIVAEAAAAAGCAVWTSPARRCRLVAAAIGAACGSVPVPDPRLLELDFGDWEGREWDAVPRAALDLWAAAPVAFAPPGGETGAALLARVCAVHAELVRVPGGCVVVAHGGPLKLLAALLRGTPPELLAPALLAPAQPLGSVLRLAQLSLPSRR